MALIANFFIILWDGQPIGFNVNTGGRPFKTVEPSEIVWFPTREAAETYCDMLDQACIVQEVAFVAV